MPEGFSDTISTADPGFVDVDRRDFRLKPGSACVNRAVGNMGYVDGDGLRQTLTVDRCYAPHTNLLVRIVVGTPDAGAYELGAQLGR